jgi:hypothetical protein
MEDQGDIYLRLYQRKSQSLRTRSFIDGTEVF